MEIKITGMENEVVDFNNLTTNSCTIQVLSRGFNLIRNFYFSQNSIAECLKNFKEYTATNKRFECTLGDDYDTSEWIRFSKADERGHIRVEGHFEEHSSLPQSLDFSFLTDQISVTTLLTSLNTIL
jgi:hypothetical protein